MRGVMGRRCCRGRDVVMGLVTNVRVFVLVR